MIYSGTMLGILKALPSHIWTSTPIKAFAFGLGFNWSVCPNVRMLGFKYPAKPSKITQLLYSYAFNRHYRGFIVKYIAIMRQQYLYRLFSIHSCVYIQFSNHSCVNVLFSNHFCAYVYFQIILVLKLDFNSFLSIFFTKTTERN